MFKLFSILFASCICFCSCSSSKIIDRSLQIKSLQFLNEFDVPYDFQFQNTATGGLSGIDYNSKLDVYYLISDDRSQKNNARFYTASIKIHNNKIDTVIFLEKTFLKNKTGNFYPSVLQNPAASIDPEALRLNHVTNKFVWSSEGERIVNAKDTFLQNPSVTETGQEGNFIDTFQLPEQLLMHATENGPRRNGVLEGLTFSKNYQNLFVSLEEPLYDDGERATTKDSGIIRIFNFDANTKKNVAQYAYKIDPVAHPSFPENAFKVNGISDILSLNDQQFIILERSFSTGNLSCTIKVYLADISRADNVLNVPSLKNKKDITFVSKKLLLNMDTLGIYIDNIEGVTFGPTLPDGHKTLIFVADNNFNPLEKTQFLLFRIN